MIPNPENFRRIAVQLMSLAPMTTHLESVLSDPVVCHQIESLRTELRVLPGLLRIPEEGTEEDILSPEVKGLIRGIDEEADRVFT